MAGKLVNPNGYSPSNLGTGRAGGVWGAHRSSTEDTIRAWVFPRLAGLSLGWQRLAHCSLLQPLRSLLGLALGLIRHILSLGLGAPQTLARIALQPSSARARTRGRQAGGWAGRCHSRRSRAAAGMWRAQLRAAGTSTAGLPHCLALASQPAGVPGASRLRRCGNRGEGPAHGGAAWRGAPLPLPLALAGLAPQRGAGSRHATRCCWPSSHPAAVRASADWLQAHLEVRKLLAGGVGHLAGVARCGVPSTLQQAGVRQERPVDAAQPVAWRSSAAAAAAVAGDG